MKDLVKKYNALAYLAEKLNFHVVNMGRQKKTKEAYRKLGLRTDLTDTFIDKSKKTIRRLTALMNHLEKNY